MEYYFILIPILLTVLLAIVCRAVKGNKFFDTKYKEEGMSTVMFFSIPTLVTLLLIAVMSCTMKSCNSSDTEYLSYYYTKLRHTDKWNEYIHRTCTRRVKTGETPDGKAIYKEEEYDCSYVDEHPERWIAYDNDGSEIYLNEDEWTRIKNKWKVPSIFVDMHRHYYTIDGDAQDYVWDKRKETIETYTQTHSYRNYIANSQSQFKLRDISHNEAKELGLYDYPDINGNEQNPIVGYTKYITKHDVKEIQYLNAIYGKSRQFRTFVLIYADKSPAIVEDQRCYWQGGNKNEFIICVGIDGKTNELKWLNGFTWMEDETMLLRCRDEMIQKSKFLIKDYSQWIQKNIKLWKRKEFKDFEYIEDDAALSDGQMMGILITVIIVNLIMTFIIGCALLDKYR